MGISKSNWHGNVEKDEIRDRVCANRGKAYKHCLLLPSGSLLDFKKLQENGCITKDTFITAIESDREVSSKIYHYLKTERNQNRIKDFDINSYKVECVPLHLCLQFGGKFDFIYVDTCNQLNPHILRWLFYLCDMREKIFTKNAEIHIAFCDYRQQRDFGEFLLEKINPLERIKKQSVGNFEGSDIEIHQEQHNMMYQVISMLFGKPWDHLIYKNSNSKKIMHSFSMQGANPSGPFTVACLLTQYGVTLKGCSAGFKAMLKKGKMKLAGHKRAATVHGREYKNQWLNALESRISK